MAAQKERIRVALNGYGVIGKRFADAVASQDDMEFVGVSDITADWRMRVAQKKGYRLFCSSEEAGERMRKTGLKVQGTLDELLHDTDVVVDCTPKRIGAANAERYRQKKIKFIVQGGEKHSVTGHSFVAEASYDSVIGRDATRVVSCNTTSVVRTLTALKRAGLLKRPIVVADHEPWRRIPWERFRHLLSQPQCARMVRDRHMDDRSPCVGQDDECIGLFEQDCRDREEVDLGDALRLVLEEDLPALSPITTSEHIRRHG